MDIISQLQEQVNSIALIALNTFGTLQRDAPPVRLSPNYPKPLANPTEETINITEQPKEMSAALVQAAKKFDVLVAALPLEGGEEAQVKRIAELQAENEAAGHELQKQLEAAEQELKLVQALFSQASDNCLNLKKPEMGVYISRTGTPEAKSSYATAAYDMQCEGMRSAVEETPVVIIGRRGCCMGHVVKRLLQGLGVSPAVWEVAGEAEEAALGAELTEMRPAGGAVTLPAVFIGGRLVGGLDHLMAAHISGELVPNLKQAGALWL